MIEFLDHNDNDVSVTKFLQFAHEPEHEVDFSGDEYEEEYEIGQIHDHDEANALMSNDQNIEKNARKKGKSGKNGKSKSKKPFGGPDEEVVFVEFLEHDPSRSHWLQ